MTMAPRSSGRLASGRLVGRFLLPFSALLGVTACALPVPEHAEPGPVPSGPRLSFAVIGDTQRSLSAEELVGREQNDAERARLVDQLVREDPAFVVHLGDLVAVSSPRHWAYFDELMKPLARPERPVPVFPVLGNHEYFGEGRDPSRAVRRRYPDLARGGYYAKRWGRLGLVWLDSNLSGWRAAKQAEWLGQTLALLDATRDIAGTLVFTHHPRATNGVGRDGHPGVRTRLWPALTRSTKLVALVSAHVHGYERLEHEGIPLIVSGGGGGPRVSYRTGSARSLPPQVLDRSDPRPLHYLVVRDAGDHVSITARCLDGSVGCPENGELDRLDLPLPPAPRANHP
jgi:hypothetical protein